MRAISVCWVGALSSYYPYDYAPWVSFYFWNSVSFIRWSHCWACSIGQTLCQEYLSWSFCCRLGKRLSLRKTWQRTESFHLLDRLPLGSNFEFWGQERTAIAYWSYSRNYLSWWKISRLGRFRGFTTPQPGTDSNLLYPFRDFQRIEPLPNFS